MSPPAPLDHVRVLVAHRDAQLRAEARALLAAAGAEVLEAGARHPAADVVRAERPHVVLLDEGLDGEHPGSSLVRDVAGDPELLGTAVILHAPRADVDDVVGALRAGAADVWAAPHVAPELIARVRLAYRSRQLLDLAMRRFTDLEDLAYRDELTELRNRRGTLRQLEVLVSRARRHGQQLAILLIDADRFKKVNDTHGHAVGDVVLRELARRLGERLRREDLIGRWGGEEFLVALPETTRDGAAAVAESLRAGAGDEPFVVEGGVSLSMTISVGVAAWNDDVVGDVVDRADRALYAAKAAGRDRVSLESLRDAA
jgi:two-component system cell cycle response regulator